ncbi:MAG: porin family protein [Bacteroidia bacterium]|nr:porin family protein [Bacteroidia bacterium]
MRKILGTILIISILSLVFIELSYAGPWFSGNCFNKSTIDEPSTAPSLLSPLYLIPQKPMYSFGFTSGLNISNFRFNNVLEYEGDLHFQVNSVSYSPMYHLFAIAKFNNYLSMEIGINYEQKGGNYDNITYLLNELFIRLYSEDEFRVQNNYLTIPFTARFSIGNPIRLNLFGGYYFSYLLKSTTKTYKMHQDWTVNQIVTTTNRLTYNSIDYFKKTDSGIVLGGSVQVPIYKIRLGPTFSLVLDGRCNIGMVPIDNFSVNTADFFGKPVNNNNEIKNFSYSISAGIIISLPEPYNRIE